MGIKDQGPVEKIKSQATKTKNWGSLRMGVKKFARLTILFPKILNLTYKPNF